MGWFALLQSNDSSSWPRSWFGGQADVTKKWPQNVATDA
jgi:hypothetical protein